MNSRYDMQLFARTIGIAAAILAGAQIAGAQNQQQAPLRIAASTFASVEVHINARRIGTQWYEEDASLTGPSRIAITYGQPHARGRRIEGGLIPLDTVWRFGANAATTLHTDVDMTLGDARLEAGDYSLLVLYTRAGWQLVVNRRTGIWGTDYDRARDVGRIPLTSRTLAEPEESLTIYLVPESARPAQGYAELRGLMRIKWGRTELSTTWRVAQ
jgi:DUF2911 family protein